MTALVVLLALTAALLGLSLWFASGDRKHAEQQLAQAVAERDLLRSRISDASALAAPLPPPLPRRPKPRADPTADQPLTDTERSAWADLINHWEQP